MVDEDFFFPDKVSVYTAADGQCHSNVKAQVGRDKILLLEGTLPITEGDELRRELPNGIIEEFTIEHVEFKAADMDFPAMMTAHVHKRGSVLHDRQHKAQQTSFNVTGANARVNVSSIDNSANIVTVNSEAVFSQLAEAIKQQVNDVTLRSELALAVQEMERTRGTHDFTVKFQTFMALAANCMTVVMTFVPALTAMLK